MDTTNPIYLVTGAAGMLGKALTRMLLAQGKSVRTLDRLPLDLAGTEHIQADLRDHKALAEALKGVDTVFHVASYISLDPREDALMYEVNVEANQKLIDLAIKARVHKLIYTSSIDVVFEGKPIRRGDESVPYPNKFTDYYSYTKATAEQAVLMAHNPMGLLTCSLRPAGIYGPGDAVRVPSIMDQVRKGKWFSIGKGDAEFNHVYVDNVAHAHLLAADALHPESELGGQSYFITDHAPSFFFDFFEPIIEGLGYRVKRKTIPYGLAMFSARLLTWWDHLPWNKKRTAPTLTPYTVASCGRDFSFVHDRASEEFGYSPLVSQQEALQATIKDMRKRGYAAHTSAQQSP